MFCTCNSACTVTPAENTVYVLLSCLPFLDIGSWGYNKVECCFARLTSFNSEVKDLQEPPNVTLLFSKGKGCWEWSFITVISIAGGFCSNFSAEHGN